MPIYFTDGGSGLQLIPKEYENSVLIHHGVKGQKHGIRRWQNEDGSLTPEGYIHYGVGQGNKQKSDTKEEAHKNLGQKIKERIQSMYLPPHMIGKSKEEIKAWEQKERDKFEKESKKEQEEIEFGKRLQKFDKFDSDDQDKVIKDVEKRLEKLHAKKFLNHDERKIQDGLQDWINQVYDKKKNDANKIGLAKGNERVAYLKSLKDGSDEKNKAIEDLLREIDKDANERAMRFNEFQKAGLKLSEIHKRNDQIEDMDPKSYELNQTGAWLFGEIEAKSGSWYWNKGVSDGFKKITDTIDDLRSQIQSVREQIYRDVPDSTKRYKQMNNDPRIIHLETQIKDLQSKLPEQVLKDLGVPVTSENIKSITPFVFWD